MPTFQISDPAAAVSLSDAADNGHPSSRGNVVFAVENTSAANRTATVRVKPQDEADIAFFSINGSALTNPAIVNLDFSGRQSQNVTVAIAARRGTKPKACGFRLQVALESDPDNDAAESRPIAFTLAALPPETPKPPFPWAVLIAAMVLVLAVAGGGAWYALRDGGPPNPQIEAKVKGKSLEFAEGIVTGANLTPVRRIVQHPEIATNTVFAAARDPADPSKIILSYDPGIASLTGMPIEAAQALVAKWGLTPDLVSAPADGLEPGLVAAAKLADNPARIALTYDEGVEIPYLVGLSPDVIQEIFINIPSNKATVAKITTFPDPGTCTDLIVDQEPHKVPQGGKVRYRTGQQLFFTVKDGTGQLLSCFVGIRPIWREKIRALNPRILIQ